MKTETSEKLAELIEWLSTNPVHVLRLCVDRGEVPAEDLLETLEALQDMGYWELMVLLVLKNDIDPVVSQTLTRYTGTRIAEALRQDGILKFSRDLNIFSRKKCKKKENAAEKPHLDCQKTSLRIKAKGKLVRKKTVRVVFRIKS